MRQIEIEEEVFHALASRAHGFGQTPNDVLRELLALSPPGVPVRERPGTNGSGTPHEPRSELVEFLLTPGYRVHHKSVDRYLAIIAWLHSHHGATAFDKILDGYSGTGDRVLFAKDAQRIERTGQNVHVKRVPGIPYFAMVTLDNARKRAILTQVLVLFDHPTSDINVAVSSITDLRTSIEHVQEL